MHILETDASQWDAFVAASPQGTAFHRSLFLQAFGRDVAYYLCRKGDAVLGGMAFCLDGRDAVTMPFQQYGGLLFAQGDTGQSFADNERRFRVAEAFAEHLSQAHGAVSCSNHWSVTDLRPFDWHNYGQAACQRYAVAVRYTSLLDLDGTETGRAWSQSRRYSYNKSRKQDMATTCSTDVDLMLRLYRMTFARQEIDVSGPLLEVLERLSRAHLEAGTAVLTITWVGDVPGSAGLFLLDRKDAFYLVGASDPEMRAKETGTRNLVDSMVLLRDRFSCRSLDFVGINSPGRGWFKSSFGGSVTPYFTVAKPARTP
jgi:hypothetical protein